MAATTEWMPVFSMPLPTLYAAHPDVKHIRQPEPTIESESQYQRIGTAIARPDGGYTIHFSSPPTGGKFMMRPPKPHEQPYSG